MGYIVVHRGPANEKAHRDYLLVVSRRLLDRGVGLDRVPRLPADGHAVRWLYVAADEAEARSLAEELKRYTEEDIWEVQQVEGAPVEGPLQPLVVEATWTATGIGFTLAPISADALQRSFSGAELLRGVWLKTPPREHSPTRDELRRLATHLMPVLTNLDVEQLAVFGGFEVIDPVSEDVLVLFTPFRASNGEGTLAGPASPRDNAASPDHCKAPSAG
jgi:hypothetical protein